MARKKANENTPPKAIEKHSKSQILNELRLMLTPSGGLTAGGFLLLVSTNPVFVGGEVTEEAVNDVLELTGTTSLEEALEVIKACFRCFECLKGTALEHLEYYTPEWLADLVGMAGQSCSMTYHDAVWGIPLVALTHLALATYRRNGGKYERPKDFSEVDKWLIEYNEKLRQESNGK